ncbi:MAG: VOC family protein [Flavobacteriaceae bacterium]|nr:VOC family protein [Flavobacteriaceae bacterium]
MQEHNNHIHYVEFGAADLQKIKEFYSRVFDWKFTDYGPDYTAFSNSGLEGGFEKRNTPAAQGSLVVLYHQNLETVQQRIIEASGKISKPIFSFPGGRRFHFTDPAGNELAVWSDAME